MPSDEQAEIAGTVSALLSRRAPVVGLGSGRDAAIGADDPDLWRECCELGWLALGLPEADGGVGFSMMEEAVLFEELGRGLAAGPFLAGVLGAHVAAAANDRALTDAIATGAQRVALATAVGPITVGRTVTGTFSVSHPSGAEHLLVSTPDIAVLLPAAKCGIEQIDGVDPTIAVGRVQLVGVEAVAHAPAAAQIYERALVLAAATSVGIAQAALAVAVDYAKQRQQFGKAIGSYQAIKHPCADMAVRCDGAEAQVTYAAVALHERLPGAAFEALVAKYYADEAARSNADTAVQVHGAIGFTSEATPYRFVLRAHLMGRTLISRPDVLNAIIGDRAAASAR